MLKITRDELPMEQGVYGGCPLCPLYSLLFILKVSKRSRMFVLQVKSKVFFIQYEVDKYIESD